MEHTGWVGPGSQEWGGLGRRDGGLSPGEEASGHAEQGRWGLGAGEQRGPLGVQRAWEGGGTGEARLGSGLSGN